MYLIRAFGPLEEVYMTIEPISWPDEIHTQPHGITRAWTEEPDQAVSFTYEWQAEAIVSRMLEIDPNLEVKVVKREHA